MWVDGPRVDRTAPASEPTDPGARPPDRSARARPHAEVGSLAPLSHVIPFDEAGTELDRVKDGGQDNLCFYPRLSADLDLGKRHSIVLLHQPLDLRTTVRLDSEPAVDGSQQRSNREVGQVPHLELRARQPLGAHGSRGVEADGFYAPVVHRAASSLGFPVR